MGDMTREPSMEEILSSIRRVIARDEGRLAAAAGQAADAAGNDDGGDDADDVLELTSPTGQEIPVAEPAVAAPVMAAATAGQAPPAATLVSDDSAEASRKSLDALAAALSAQPAPGAAAAGLADVSLTAMTEALLRPMLREWLDANLPVLVERLVAREIARITGSRL